MDAKKSDWERLLKAAAELQQIVPGAVLVGGTAAAIHARHRISLDREREVLPLVQLARQLAEPNPYDREDIDIKGYKGIVPPWDKWENIKKQCEELSYWITTFIAQEE